jgi:hypothetical protein
LSLAATLAACVGLCILATQVSYWLLLAYPLVGVALCWWAIASTQDKRDGYDRLDAVLIRTLICIGWGFMAGTCLIAEWGALDRELTLVGYIREWFFES